MLSEVGDSRLSWAGWNRVGGGLRAASPVCCGRPVSRQIRRDPQGRTGRVGCMTILRSERYPTLARSASRRDPPTLARFTIPPPCPTPAAASPGYMHPLGYPSATPLGLASRPPARDCLHTAATSTPSPAMPLPWPAPPPAHTALCRPRHTPARPHPLQHATRTSRDSQPTQSLPSRPGAAPACTESTRRSSPPSSPAVSSPTHAPAGAVIPWRAAYLASTPAGATPPTNGSAGWMASCPAWRLAQSLPGMLAQRHYGTRTNSSPGCPRSRLL